MMKVRQLICVYACRQVFNLKTEGHVCQLCTLECDWLKHCDIIDPFWGIKLRFKVKTEKTFFPTRDKFDPEK